MSSPLSSLTPVFIGRTRSFWLGILPALLVSADVLSGLIADPGTALPVARLLAALTGQSVEEAGGLLLRLSPLFALVVASSRAGAARPYSLDPRAGREGEGAAT
ncbi:hypothetical protein ACFOHK_09710 [Falsigemmobacter intermedius]|uniref:Uncharacterized protein n=1 Tax=Falsigemmobacter intermedius TaxID=1553448 RepID=A0A444MCM5_9RHOB|nr:hypothetical protein [Falsigemmobacter intermedius]RWY41785.1 hypothetical protein EP867_08620 [Falsigemmobacter intermedius]